MESKKLTYDDVPTESREAVHAVRDAQQQIELARQQQIVSIGDMVQDRVENVLARGTEQEKAIILARVPYICQDIKGINSSLREIKELIQDVNDRNEKKYVSRDQFAPYKWVLGIIGSVIITGVVTALLSQIIIK